MGISPQERCRMNSTCMINTCNKKILVKDLCSFHYYRKLRGVPLDKPFGRKYSLNEHYFDIIDTPSKAYLLGILMTDGCVWKHKSQDSYYCKLMMIDKDLVKFFKAELDTNYPIKFDASKRAYSVALCSKIIFFSLGSYGVTPNKTFYTIYPQNLNGFDGDFIRGCLDGDGSIVHYKGKYPRNRISWTGTYTLLSQIEKTLRENCSLKFKRIYKHVNKRSYLLQYQAKNDIGKLINYIYANADDSFYLERKQNNIMKIFRERKVI